MADARNGLKPLMAMAVVFEITRTFANGALHDLAGFGPWVGLVAGLLYLHWATGQDEVKRFDAPSVWAPTVAGFTVFVGVVSIGLWPVFLFGLLLAGARKNVDASRLFKEVLFGGVRAEPEVAPTSRPRETSRVRKESLAAPLAALFDIPTPPAPEPEARAPLADTVASVEPVTFTSAARVVETVIPQAAPIATSSLGDTWQPEPIATSTMDNWGLSTSPALSSGTSGFDEALALLQGRKPEDPPRT